MAGVNQGPDVRSMLAARGALLSGHFLLSSGLHSDTYVQCALLMQHHPDARVVAAAQGGLWRDTPVDAVCGPAPGGGVVGHELARALAVRGFHTEPRGGVTQLRRGFRVEPGERMPIAEDVVTTAGGALAARALLEDQGATVVGVTSIVDRGEAHDLPVPLRSLVRVRAPVWAPEDCPLCADGGSPVNPGDERHVPPNP